MSQMDIAGAIAAAEHAQNKVVTIAVNGMQFHAPVHVSDVVCCYTEVLRVGTTSIAVHVETWVLRSMLGERRKVTEAEFTFVAIGRDGRPTPVTARPGTTPDPTPKEA
jgi:acyl-CoA thioesterase YciA